MPGSVLAMPVSGTSLGRYRLIGGPLGSLALMQSSDGSLSTTWLKLDQRSLGGWRRDDRLLPDLARRLADYCQGEVVDFSDVPTPEGPDFFTRCWDACRGIARGRTISYGELARRAGSTASASRAAGQAMRHNPLPVIVPCHRVLAADGTLHGFAGTADARSPAVRLKHALLTLETTAPRPG